MHKNRALQVQMRDSYGKYLLIVCISLLFFLFTNCNLLSGTDVLQGSDAIVLVITITSPVDGSPYAATMPITGSITDAADVDGDIDALSAASASDEVTWYENKLID